MLNFTIIGRSYAVVKRERETLCTICSVSLRSHVLQDRHRQERDGDVEQTQNIVTKEPPFPAAPTPSPAPPPPSPATTSLVFISIVLSFQEYYVNGFMHLLTFGDWASSLGVGDPPLVPSGVPWRVGGTQSGLGARPVRDPEVRA